MKELTAALRREHVLPASTAGSLLRNLQSSNLQAVLVTLTMLDTVALNCGPAVRGAFAAREWVAALVKAGSAGMAAQHTLQMLVNWTVAFDQEALGQSSQAALQQAAVQGGPPRPHPDPHAYHMVSCLAAAPQLLLPSVHCTPLSAQAPKPAAFCSAASWSGAAA